jgi:NitT/TauT family transport system ATP-binding protein/sulfonate transport system ATP-binding protein
VDLTGMGFARTEPPLFGALKFTVAPGEVVALIGPSGIGKTTLLRMIGGVERGFGGQITVGGQPAHLAPPPGFVFQDARLLPWADAAANLRAVRPGLTGAQVAASLAQVGLAGREAAYPRQLSGGMQRRLGLARALVANPRLLLLDEPFVSLDEAVVRDLRAVFQTIFRTQNPTVILVSHDPQDAAHLAHRAILLAGRPATITHDLPLTHPDPAHRLTTLRATNG